MLKIIYLRASAILLSLDVTHLTVSSFSAAGISLTKKHKLTLLVVSQNELNENTILCLWLRLSFTFFKLDIIDQFPIF